ncbi:MAG TPA: HD domain-containing phosphohydrolase [Bauldia sp.]|nr:HD domain-containing phosphohydrolase [Bauldia sp.]
MQTPAPDEEALRLSELLSALSHALDLTEGQPQGHCVRCCWIGTAIGREIGLSEVELWELYYTLLLKDVGCSSNAARISALYKTDDLLFKHDAKIVGTSLPALLNFVVTHTAGATGFADRVQTLLSVVPKSPAVAHEVIATRCERGADIARRLRFSDRVADGIHDLDEHWDGNGHPAGKKGDAIPVYARIALLAQVVDVFNTAYGRIETRKEIGRRSGSWFDPDLVAAFTRAQGRHGFWEGLASPHLETTVLDLEPARHAKQLDDDFLDDIAEAFAEVVDSKSPYTSGHSSRVAEFADMIAAELDFAPASRRWLRRGALLHDIGKLGVSNAILDKPGPLTAEERQAMRQHAALTETILSRITAFAELARIAGAHHERLDGKGYPHGRFGDEIAIDTRVLTTADIYDALTAKRPYRSAMSQEAALEIMADEVGTAIDARCFAALRVGLAKRA